VGPIHGIPYNWAYRQTPTKYRISDQIVHLAHFAIRFIVERWNDESKLSFSMEHGDMIVNSAGKRGPQLVLCRTKPCFNCRELDATDSGRKK
jgi:hypothetical protein